MFLQMFLQPKENTTPHVRSKSPLGKHSELAFTRTLEIVEKVKQVKPPSIEDASTLKRTEHKRVRLRDYMKMAKICTERNKQKKRSVSRDMKTQKQIKESLAQIRAQKYKISKNQMHKIISDQICEEMQKAMSHMTSILSIISQSDHHNTTKEDLLYLYQVKKIVRDKFKAGLKQINQLQYMKHQSTLKFIFQTHTKESVQEDKPEHISQL